MDQRENVQLTCNLLTRRHQHNWDLKCKVDRRWCRSFFKLLVNELLVTNLFPSVTMPTLKGDIRSAILAECHKNWTCFDVKMKLQRSGILNDYLLDKYGPSTRAPAGRGAIVAGLIGGVLFLSLLFLIIFCLVKHRNSRGVGGLRGSTKKLNARSSKSLRKSRAGKSKSKPIVASKRTLTTKHSKASQKASKRSKHSKRLKESKSKHKHLGSKRSTATKRTSQQSKPSAKKSIQKSHK